MGVIQVDDPPLIILIAGKKMAGALFWFGAFRHFKLIIRKKFSVKVIKISALNKRFCIRMF